MAKAFNAWSNRSCDETGTRGRASLQFEETEPVACWKSRYVAEGEGPNVNVILFQDNNWKFRGIDGTIAKTSVTFDENTGEILDADIEVNSAHFIITVSDNPDVVQYDLQSVLTHEVGHFLGIAHSKERDAVMLAEYNSGSLGLRELGSDDVSALCTAYPPNRDAECNSTPRGGLDATCNNPISPSLCTVSAVGSSAAPVASPTAQKVVARFGSSALMPSTALVGVGVAIGAGLLRRLRSGAKTAPKASHSR